MPFGTNGVVTHKQLRYILERDWRAKQVYDVRINFSWNEKMSLDRKVWNLPNRLRTRMGICNKWQY